LKVEERHDVSQVKHLIMAIIVQAAKPYEEYFVRVVRKENPTLLRTKGSKMSLICELSNKKQVLIHTRNIEYVAHKFIIKNNSSLSDYR
jgi:hypothetical protein